MSSNELPISKELQEKILNDAAQRTSIPKEHIKLAMLNGWDNAKCPIIEARPDAHGANPRRYGFINNELLPANQKETFQKLVNHCYSDVAKADPVELARLATMFAHFGAPIGMLWLRNLNEDHPEIATPTTTFEPVIKQDGDLVFLEFYSFSHPLSQFYFCRIDFKAEGPVLKCALLND